MSETQPNVTLSDRIADTLRAVEPGSAAVAAIQAEAVAEAERLAGFAAEVKACALNPLASDAEVLKARRIIGDAIFARERLEAALPLLASLHAAELAREDQAVRRAEYDAALAERDALVADLPQYAEHAAAIEVLLCRINVSNRRCEAVNARRPAGAGFIDSAEVKARGPLVDGAAPLREQVCLPGFKGIDNAYTRSFWSRHTQSRTEPLAPSLGKP